MTRPRSRAERVRQVAGRIRWYVREFTGESAYERYVAHARAHADAGAPTGEVMTRRAFERSRTDAREADPREGFRCC
ncbi:YbdD/YjiX family protein [Streptomyces sp. NPDC096310]|uniref:YbdD/YjiX family protein n=1 Tax=Streptomyces sp. NPDC096310 TaxID=3366082 RepID=UPI00381D0934